MGDGGDTERVGDWRQSFLGQKLWPMDPRVEEIDIVDLAHHLSTINRFGGSASQPYSVAEHLVRASYIVPPEFALETLMHDGAEGLMGADIVRPLKRGSGLLGLLWEHVENLNQIAVHKAVALPHGLDRFAQEIIDVAPFGLTGSLAVMRHYMPTPVLKADNIMLMTEARDLMAPPPEPWRESGNKPLDEKIVPWGWQQSKLRFLARYDALNAARLLK